jgi:hypothetical protein
MATQSEPQALPKPQPAVFESLEEMRSKTLDAFAALAEANQRVVGKLIDLSSTAARESLRTYAELQAAAMEAVRTAPTPTLSRERIDELGRDPFAWYRRSLLDAASATQRVARLIDTNAQIVARAAERFEAPAEETGKGIREAVQTYRSRMKEIQSR